MYHVVYPKDGVDKPWGISSSHMTHREAQAARGTCPKEGAQVVKGLTGGAVRHNAIDPANHLSLQESVEDDQYDQDTVKVAKGLENLRRKNPEKAKNVLDARNKVSSELFKRRMRSAAKDAGFKRLPLGEDKIPGGKGDEKPDSDFCPVQLGMGIKVEMEHTKDPAIAKEIAKDHLSEDPEYYTKLQKAGLADELKGTAVDPKKVKEAIDAIKSGESVDEGIARTLGKLTTAGLLVGAGYVAGASGHVAPPSAKAPSAPAPVSSPAAVHADAHAEVKKAAETPAAKLAADTQKRVDSFNKAADTKEPEAEKPVAKTPEVAKTVATAPKAGAEKAPSNPDGKKFNTSSGRHEWPDGSYQYLGKGQERKNKTGGAWKPPVKEAIESIRSGKAVDEAIVEALLPTVGAKAFVMIPHSAKHPSGNLVTREYLSKSGTSPMMGHRKGILHTASYTRNGGEKHHCVEFSCKKHAQMFANTLASAGIEGHQVTGG
jgi:hypothetical protein